MTDAATTALLQDQKEVPHVCHRVALPLPRAQERELESAMEVHLGEMANEVYSQTVESSVMIVNQVQMAEMNSPITLPSNGFDTVLYENASLGQSFKMPYSNCKKTSIINYPKKSKIKKNNISYSFENSIEYKTLIQRYSSGVRLPELCSLAKILSTILSGVVEPSREEKRSFPLLIEWYHTYWDVISPMLPYIQLRDENNQVIDGRREIIEKCLQSK